MSKLCPSAQPGMDRCRVLGVVRRDGSAPMLEYLNENLPASPEVLAMAAPLKPTDVFRLAATCAEHKCPHFDGADCRLATRIVKILPEVVDSLPACTIRKDCRWFSQEGGAACKRCPEVTTVSYDLSPRMREVSGLPVVEDT
ncbi:MAG: hypothetical protein WAL71_21055 [Terriglobales bacterium]